MIMIMIKIMQLIVLMIIIIVIIIGLRLSTLSRCSSACWSCHVFVVRSRSRLWNLKYETMKCENGRRYPYTKFGSQEFIARILCKGWVAWAPFC